MSRNPPRYVLPEDAYYLREATRIACARAKAFSETERETIANAVLWIARSGYARLGDGTINPDALAEAAVLHFWNMSATPAKVHAAAQRVSL